MCLDGVDAVAVCANRGLSIATRKRLPMNALHEDLFDGAMALAAGVRDIEFIDW